MKIRDLTEDPCVFLLLKKSTLNVMKAALQRTEFSNSKQSIIKHAANIGLQPWIISKENK